MKKKDKTRTSRLRRVQAAFLLPEESYNAVYGGDERVELAALVDIVAPALTASSWREHRAPLAEVEALFTGWFAPPFDAELLEALPSLRIVLHAAGSVKPLATDAFWDRGLRLTCAAQSNAIPVSEFAFAQIILSLKQVWRAAQATKAARTFVRADALVPSVYGSTVGILSLGLIGRLVAERLRSVHVRVIAYDPHFSPQTAAELGVELCSLEEVFIQSDLVSCHTPLLPTTTHLLRERHFSSMKANATFINTARGAIVHEPELISVLARRPDLSAVLDVTYPEPPEGDSLLYALPNVLLTPHISGSVGPECRRMGRMMIEETKRYLRGEPLEGEVLREKLPFLA